MNLAVAVPEAAAMIGISESMLWRLLAAGDIAKVKIGRRTVIRVVELERFLSDTGQHDQMGHSNSTPSVTRFAENAIRESEL